MHVYVGCCKMRFRQVGYQKKLESSMGRCLDPKNHQATTIGPIWWMASWRLPLCFLCSRFWLLCSLMLQKILKNFPRNRRKFYNFLCLGLVGEPTSKLVICVTVMEISRTVKYFCKKKFIYFDHHFCSIAEHMRLMLRAYAAYAPLCSPRGGWCS